MSVTDRARELIQKSLEAIASESEYAELERLLAADPEVAFALANAARLHAGLSQHFRKQQKIGEIASLLGKSAGGPAASQNRPDRHAPPELTTGESADFNISDMDLRQFDPGHIDPDFAATGPVVSSYKARDSKMIKLTKSRGSRKRLGKHARTWAVLSLVLLVGAFFVAWWGSHSRGDHFRVLAGQVAIAAQDVAEVPINAAFEVIGNESAILELPGGGRLELKQATRATLAKDTRGLDKSDGTYPVVLELEAGGGIVTAPSDSLPFRIRTAFANVTTQGRVSVNLTIGEPSHTAKPVGGGSRALHIAVLDGTAMVEQAGVVSWLQGNEHRTLFGPNS